MKKVDLLCSFQVFENISIKNFRDLLQSVKEEHFKPKEYIVRQGSIGSKFYFVMSGIIKIISTKENDRFERYYSSGSYFGEPALMNQKRGAE